jgi:integrase
MSIWESSIKTEFASLYLLHVELAKKIKNSNRALKLTRSDLEWLKREQFLEFSIRKMINGKTKWYKIEPVNVIGAGSVKKAIEEANLRAKTIVKEIKAGVYKSKDNHCPTLLEAWTEYSNKKVSAGKMTENYFKSKNSYFNKHFKKYLHTPLLDITPENIQSIVDGMYKNGYKTPNGKHKKYAFATVLEIRKGFSILFEESEFIAVNPMKKVMFKEFDNERSFELDKDKEKLFFNKLTTYPNLKFRAIFLMLLTGRRVNEVLGLTWDRVSLENKEMKLPKRDKFGDRTHKGKESISFVLPDEVIKIISNFEHRSGFVFRSDKDFNKKIDNFRKRWSTILKECNIEDITRHDLRHWIGGFIVNHGGTLEEAAATLGQKSVRSSARYSKVKKETASKKVTEFHKFFKN